jgi:hypothetical protein
VAKETRKQRKGKKARTELSVTPISQHKKIGKDVIPPLAQLKKYPGFTPRDWTAERLPEMLWAPILLAGLGRNEALSRFRALGTVIHDRCEADDTRRQILQKVTLTGLASWNDEEFADFVNVVVRGDAELFSAFTQFDALPGVDRWKAIVPSGEFTFDVLKSAVGSTLWHQSQDSTDCRWMRVLAQMLSGSLTFPSDKREMVKGLIEYPNYGDMREVRPTIRSTESICDAGPDGVTLSEWSPVFWQHAFDITRDDHVRATASPTASTSVVTLASIRELRESLRLHFDATTLTTIVDPKHEVAFGLCAYAIDILVELTSVGNSTGILGRMGLRALTELLINFANLAKHDEVTRWARFRDYGYGQAKLAFLKILDTDALPGFVTVETLELLSNEDLWHEFREMHIGNWTDSDLRKLAESTNIKKDIYDKYYDWSSAFIHANWGAVRNSEFEVCFNPLHRLHRVMGMSRTTLPDIIGDSVDMVNRILAILDGLYAGFGSRLAPVAINPLEGL